MPPPARPGGPRVIAHRGSSFEHPEHTRSAYRAALADGADGLECDIRLTRDLVPVLLHDSRIDATTSGRGPVGEYTAGDLDRVEVHGRPVRGAGRHGRRSRGPADSLAGGGPPRRDPGECETGVLRLDEFLAIAGQSARPVELAIETKHPARAGRQIEAAVLEALAAAPTARAMARIMSFSSGALRRLRSLDATLPTVLLLSELPAGRREPPLPEWVDIVGPSIRQLRRDPGLVARLHDAGHEVHVWTVDHVADVDHCVALGVDAIITNRPADVLRRLGRPG